MLRARRAPRAPSRALTQGADRGRERRGIARLGACGCALRRAVCWAAVGRVLDGAERGESVPRHRTECHRPSKSHHACFETFETHMRRLVGCVTVCMAG
eukprot:5170367-Prymnesium_polylepis.2